MTTTLAHTTTDERPAKLSWHRPTSLVRGPSNLYAQLTNSGVCVTVDVFRSGDSWSATSEAHTFRNAGSGTNWITGSVPEAKLFHGGHDTQRAAKLAAAMLATRAMNIATSR